MKRCISIAVLLTWFGFAAARNQSASAADTNSVQAPGQQVGTVCGRVINAVTANNLEGAVVKLEGTSLQALTERGGVYHLQVPAGNYTLAISTLG